MKLIAVNLLVLIVAIVFLLPVKANAAFEQYLEKVHYQHIDRTTGSPSLEAKKIIGAKDADMTIYIWGMLGEKYTQDFFTNTYPILKNTYPEASFVFNHRTFAFHGPEGSEIAKLTECTAAQNLFWENIDGIITNAKNPNQTSYLKSVNQQKLKTCLSSPATSSVIKASNEDADSMGINSIPTVIIKNNRGTAENYDLKVVGSQQIEVFDEAIYQAMEQGSESQDSNDPSQMIFLEERLASAEAELQIMRDEQSFMQGQIDRILNLIESVLKSVDL